MRWRPGISGFGGWQDADRPPSTKTDPDEASGKLGHTHDERCRLGEILKLEYVFYLMPAHQRPVPVQAVHALRRGLGVQPGRVSCARLHRASLPLARHLLR